MVVIQFYAVLFLSHYSALLGSQKPIFHQESLFFLFYHFKQLYFFQTNTGNCCLYSGVFQYHFSASQICLFGFYAMLFLGEKKMYLFYFIVRIQARKGLKIELYFYVQFLGMEIF